MIKLLIECKEIDRDTTNRSAFTALDVIQRQTQVDSRASVNILYCARDPPSRVRRMSISTRLIRDIEEMNRYDQCVAYHICTDYNYDLPSSSQPTGWWLVFSRVMVVPKQITSGNQSSIHLNFFCFIFQTAWLL